MIDYEVLCRTIEDWRAGRRPSIDFSATPAHGRPADTAPPYDDGGYGDQGYGAPYQGQAAGDPGQSYEQLQYQEPAQRYGDGSYGDPAQSYDQGHYGGYDQGAYQQAPPVPEAGYEQYDDATQAFMPAYQGQASEVDEEELDDVALEDDDDPR